MRLLKRTYSCLKDFSHDPFGSESLIYACDYLPYVGRREKVRVCKSLIDIKVDQDIIRIQLTTERQAQVRSLFKFGISFLFICSKVHIALELLLSASQTRTFASLARSKIKYNIMIYVQKSEDNLALRLCETSLACLYAFPPIPQPNAKLNALNLLSFQYKSSSTPPSHEDHQR